MPALLGGSARQQLDLDYIDAADNDAGTTEACLAAMGRPWRRPTMRTSGRNNVDDVAEYLNKTHRDNCMVG